MQRSQNNGVDLEEEEFSDLEEDDDLDLKAQENSKAVENKKAVLAPHLEKVKIFASNGTEWQAKGVALQGVNPDSIWVLRL